ncbi:hypothetical protein J4E93_003457 [Alternaria ventricosa]|uniref:uncharacterized protein n=1 Tax=Alternaria ventricosa TaxID=1187951 RepID=UPI0020C2410C|nr:uncharacterized protein J4E93_003457 [Alternaria ventricosa]KAI4649143.1 hypothetical protein J4E93_003457 [Alternaria ventricosa]
MPPKRKFKGTKVISNSPLKAPPASALSNKRSSLQGSKTSRLAPSVPFQMTTRRGAKGTSNHTSSAGPSSASSGSRRSSLDENAQNEDATPEHEDARPAKRSRTSSDSGSPQRSNGSFDNNTPMNGTQTPELQKPASSATSTAPKTAGKKRRASDDSSQSSKTRPNGVLTRTQSDVSEQQPRKKRKIKESQTDTAADQPPELTDASTAPNSPEQVPDVDGSQSLQNVLPTNGDAPAKSGRRLPGRRRQPHPDINVETDLRRQLNLKMSYRSLAKVQKALLEELANRTTKNLEDDPQYHKKCPEYEAVMAQLDQRRDSRLDQINSLRTYRLEELERVRIAEEHIQREQYVNRFRELQDDFMLQIFFRAKQLEREMKSQHADATDDEDNILPPTFSDEPHHADDYRIGSKFASRSRAYVEADKELENDSVRRKFTAARVAFVENDEEADDSIEDVAGGFAKFDGPDRTEAVAHYNIASLADAAIEVERTPTPQPEPKAIEVIPNEHAALLMMLADLSAHQPRTTAAPKPQYHYPDPRQQPPPPPRATTPVIKQEFVREKSPDFAQPAVPLGLPSQAAHSSPPKGTQVAVDLTQNASRSEPNAAPSTKETDAPAKTTPRLSTHRIMDILNDDQEVPVSRTRESQSSTQQPSTPSMRESSTHPQTPSRSDALRVDAVMNKEEPPIDQALMDALSGPPQSNPPSSPPSNTQSWQHPSVPPQTRESDESLRRRDPLQKIRELLDRKARELGREPPDRSHYRQAPAHWRNSMLPSINTQDRGEVAAYDPTRPSTGLYDALPGNYPSRRQSHEQAPQPWEQHGRRTSGHQVSQQSAASPYQAHAPQPHYGEHKQGPTPPTHQSPYAPPSGSLPLPPKPPGPLPSAPPINFRFAHYDPAPPRQPYPPQSPSYPPTSHPPQGPPQPSYQPAYGGAPSYQGGYIPPPGSFQAPPPPPSSMAPYQPLKIHQYGGQPILPANMAPPPHSGPPPLPFIGQSGPPQQQGPPPQHQQQQQQQQAYSPTHPHPPSMQYEQREPHSQSNGERSSDPQSRPRRQYRSYHAPGTQFRSYQGPGEQRRRGG